MIILSLLISDSHQCNFRCFIITCLSIISPRLNLFYNFLEKASFNNDANFCFLSALIMKMQIFSYVKLLNDAVPDC
jgi:hypothetical protein